MNALDKHKDPLRYFASQCGCPFTDGIVAADAFFCYLEEKFTLGPFGCFGRDLLDNVLRDAQNEWDYVGGSLSKVVDYYYRIIPEISRGEAAAFCDDTILTQTDIREKYRFWKEYYRLKDTEQEVER